MAKITTMLLMGCLAIQLIACTSRGASFGIYHHHHFGPRWGVGGYHRDRVIIIPPEEIEPEYEATPLPSGPEDMPDMGMPDMDFDDF